MTKRRFLLPTLLLPLLFAGLSPAQERSMSVFLEIDGDPVYTVLPPDTIPAIRDPQFVTGKPARDMMSVNEPVIGLLLDGEARAYSLWHLDVHEIVNDEAGGKKFAVTW